MRSSMKYWKSRLFTVPRFSIRLLKLSALHYRRPSWMSVKSTFGAGDSLGGGINPDAHPIGRYETKMATHTGNCSILMILRKNRGL